VALGVVLKASRNVSRYLSRSPSPLFEEAALEGVDKAFGQTI
jgi:hypothetical protein